MSFALRMTIYFCNQCQTKVNSKLCLRKCCLRKNTLPKFALQLQQCLKKPCNNVVRTVMQRLLDARFLRSSLGAIPETSTFGVFLACWYFLHYHCSLFRDIFFLMSCQTTILVDFLFSVFFAHLCQCVYVNVYMPTDSGATTSKPPIATMMTGNWPFACPNRLRATKDRQKFTAQHSLMNRQRILPTTTINPHPMSSHSADRFSWMLLAAVKLYITLCSAQRSASTT